MVADALTRDKSVEALALADATFGLTTEELRKLQESDARFQLIPEQHRYLTEGVWRDHGNRLFLPESLSELVTSAVHEVAHAGFKSTLNQVQTSYVWPHMRKDIKNYISACASCQSSKVTTHVKPPFKDYGLYSKFAAIHIDFVGPLPAIQGRRYLVTIFDRA